MNSPMVKWSIHNDGVCSWRLIHSLYDKNQLDEQTRAVVEFIRQHNSMRVTRLVLWAFLNDRAAQFR